MLVAVALSGAAGLGIVAMWTDWFRRDVPHAVVLGLVGLWCVTAVAAPAALGGTATAALLCGVAMLVAGFLLFLPGWLGGGDGKLAGALALWLGPQDLAIGLVAAAVLLLLLVMVPVFGGVTHDFRARGIPFACALVPPSVVLLGGRAFDAAAA